MNASIDLSGEDDVYANIHGDSQANIDSAPHEIRIISDPLPTALARIFGLMSMMSVVPLSSSSSLNNDGTISLDIRILGETPSTIDLLKRKITQLTETVTVSHRGERRRGARARATTRF